MSDSKQQSMADAERAIKSAFEQQSSPQSSSSDEDDVRPSSSSKPAEKEKPSDSYIAKHKAVWGAFDEVITKSSVPPGGLEQGYLISVGAGLEQESEKNTKETCKSGEDNVAKFRGKESMFKEDDVKLPVGGDRGFKKPEGGFKKPSRPGNRPYEPPRNRQVPYEGKGGSRGDRGVGRDGKRAPDFRANPDKYTKYSLADVDLPTNSSNSQAAFAFLDQVKKRKVGESSDEEATVQEGAKFTFKKPTKKQRVGREKTDEDGEEAASEKADEKEEDAADEGGSKVVLPASEVGVKKKSKDKDGSEMKEKRSKKSKQMSLSHLMDEEEDDED